MDEALQALSLINAGNLNPETNVKDITIYFDSFELNLSSAYLK
jgi:hypothetical protein